MNKRLHAILAFFLAAWLPFCCCQVRAVAGSLMPASPGCHASSQLPACCRAHCATTELTNSSGDHASTNTAPSGETPRDSGKSCCTSCKDRVLPWGTTVPAGDTIGVELQVAAFILTDYLQYPAVATPSLSAKRCTGPPGAPCGRAVLAQSGILLV